MARNKTNPKIIQLITDLKQKSYTENVALWKDVARRLERPTRRQAEVNLSQINRYTTPQEVVLVPGKVLGSGILDHQVQVAALSFSKKAEEKITTVGGECLDIMDLMEKNPTGSGVRIIE